MIDRYSLQQLRRPEVQAFRASLMKVARESVASRSIARVDRLADGASRCAGDAGSAGAHLPTRAPHPSELKGR